MIKNFLLTIAVLIKERIHLFIFSINLRKLFLQFASKKYIMKRTIAFLSVNFLLSCIAFSQSFKGQIDSALLPKISSSHYISEYTLDAPVNAAAWSNQPGGIHAAFGSENALYFRTEVPEIKNEAASWNATGWKGERLNTQIVVWSTDTLQQVRFKISDLKNEKGNLLSKENFQMQMERYVLSAYPYDSRDATCGDEPLNKAYLLPDRLESFDRFDLPGKTVRPVWVSCNIPSTAESGIYKGTIEVSSENKHVVLPLSIKVQNQTLPPPHDWKFRLDLWQNPWSVAEHFHVQPWSDEHKAILKKHLKLYADAGGTYITTYAVYSPWADVTYSPDKEMIKWIRQKNGAWKFDYKIFDQYVELAMSIGIDKAITIYTPIPWGNRFRYFDEATGNYVFESWPAISDTFKINWNIFLHDLKTHLQKRGWLDKAYLGINENTMEETLGAIKVIRENSKDWKITYAGDWNKNLDTLLDDYCVKYAKEPNDADKKARDKKGFTTTYYVACDPVKPNNFVFSPPIEARWEGWYAAAKNYDGFLRWAYDNWPEDPLRDARFAYWPTGDCFMVYPGSSSIRFEKLREGISDYEKINIVRTLASKSSDAPVKKLILALDDHLKNFINEKHFNEKELKNEVDKGRELINELSEKLMK